ncbi:unnamed protein product [Phytophthora fragariaefolia]|uniref:Unnamed protein product n=1 Tax=Phytophthora fragariaefolia TaxID=1490495 RepID=A0A9W6UBJ6_9STRA|nr:unnamed protein product [Phytophthora fragariaefolia]
MVDKVTTTMLNQEYWIRIDGKGFLKKRSKAQVIQMSPWIAPDVANPNFCYAELFLHSPWRSLDDLPQTDEECIAAFIDAQEQNLGKELLLESNAKVARQHHLELLKRSHIVQVLEHLPPSEYVFVDTSTIPTVRINMRRG